MKKLHAPPRRARRLDRREGDARERALGEQLRERTAQLDAANAELRSFAYSLAHDLRSPLTSIDRFTHVLEAHATLHDAQAVRAMERIRAGVRQMTRITDAMLMLAHLSDVTVNREPVDLADLARNAFLQLREHAPDRAASLEVPDSLPATGDRALLARAMIHLVGNAWKFSGSKPATRIRVGAESGAGAEPVFFVADEGAGFDMAHASQLFGPFRRLHSAAEFDGMGIGLALVRRIVQLHGGEVWAHGQPGEGATLRFTLPARG